MDGAVELERVMTIIGSYMTAGQHLTLGRWEKAYSVSCEDQKCDVVMVVRAWSSLPY
jgi:hypothetical protein